MLEDRYDHMQVYYPVKLSFHAREFPTAWRLIDQGFDVDVIDKEVQAHSQYK
jgi:anti-sigma regulatory factor (Ser/Thr protein kinase)